jgi:hypothetical protein
MLGLATLVPYVLAHALEIAQRLLARSWHADRRELTRTVKACQRARVDAVDVDAAPARRGVKVGTITSQLTPRDVSRRWVS